MNKTDIRLSDLSTHEKFILRICGDNKNENESEKITNGYARQEANYLTSLKLLEYCSGSRYRLTPEGRELYLLDSLRFASTDTVAEVSKDEVLISN